MNANRRLQEFILKLVIRQHEADQCDKLNKQKLNSILDDLQMSNTLSDNKYCNKSLFKINDK